MLLHYIYAVTMRGESDPTFRGFMIQGRVVADDSRTGTFPPSGTNYRAECDNNVSLYLYGADGRFTLFISYRLLLHILIEMKRLQLNYRGLLHLLELVPLDLGQCILKILGLPSLHTLQNCPYQTIQLCCLVGFPLK